MKGFIYIASAFETVNRSVCGQQGSWIDNDPHFWSSPPTWGICRNDLRAQAEPGDVVFFVLPRRGRHPQMIFGYLTIARIISHMDAYHSTELASKRMKNGMPNGNIIVNAKGDYNRFDAGVHRHKFDKIRRHYAIGMTEQSKMLTADEIQRLAPNFLNALGTVIGVPGDRAIDIITRRGRELTAAQVSALLKWLNGSYRAPWLRTR
jgi:hypothetical protein